MPIRSTMLLFQFCKIKRIFCKMQSKIDFEKSQAKLCKIESKADSAKSQAKACFPPRSSCDFATINYIPFLNCVVATISRLLKIIGFFCKRALWKRLYSAKETCNCKELTNRSHPICGKGAGTEAETYVCMACLVVYCCRTHGVLTLSGSWHLRSRDKTPVPCLWIFLGIFSRGSV